MASANKLWFLVWRRNGKTPFATVICGYTRTAVLDKCIKMFGGENKWRSARKDGARIERIDVLPSNAKLTGVPPTDHAKGE